MLPRRKRLSRAAFSAASRGKRHISPHFSVTVTSAPEGRAAAVVSKQVARSAVDRHRLKRRVLDAVAPYTNAPHALIVYARAGSASLPYHDIRKELDDLLRTALAV